MTEPGQSSFLSFFEVFATSLFPLPEDMGREPDGFALISDDSDGDTRELVDGTVHVDAVFLGVGG